MWAGLRVAVDPRLCAALEERFREDIKGVINYFTCTELHAAVWRVLGHWEAAHRAISFVDVTETCAAEGLDELCTVADIYFDRMSLQAEFPPSLFRPPTSPPSWSPTAATSRARRCCAAPTAR